MASQRTLPQTQWARTHSANVVLDYIMRHSFTLHLGVLLCPCICILVFMFVNWKCCYYNITAIIISFTMSAQVANFLDQQAFLCTKGTQRHMYVTVLRCTTLCVQHVHAACSKKLICQFLLTNTRLCCGNKVYCMYWPTSVSKWPKFIYPLSLKMVY